MKKYHIFPIIFWIGLSLFVMILSYKLGTGEIRNPGPGFFPFLLGLLLFAISLYLLMGALKQRDETRKEGQNQVRFRKISLVVVSLFFYTILLEKLGFLVTTTLLLIILYGCGGSKKRWKIILLASVLTVLVTYFCFSYLGVLLPAGILKF